MTAGKDHLGVNKRVALVSQDRAFAQAVQTHLQQQLGFAAFQTDFDAIQAHLGPDTDGLLVVALTSAPDRGPLVRLVQDVSLQKLPPFLILVDGPTAWDMDLAPLQPFLYRRLRWPTEAEALVSLIRNRFASAEPFLGLGEETLEEVLSRRLLAHTPSLLPLVDRVALAAKHDVTVLLTGETGTGKTFFARLVHDYSPRHTQKFLPVACGALHASLLESELFGHAKGAFTGADRAKVGKFAAVGGGTLLLDEIDTLGLEQQAALLRVLETGEFEPVGSIETQHCHARLIVASNLNLEEAVMQGKFRPDLYFRLNVMSFHLPPLRERVHDIAPLARAMAARFNRKFAKDLFDLSPQALAALESYAWPGNIRQLENVIQQAVLVSNGPELLLKDLPSQIQDLTPKPATERRSGIRALHQQRDQTERNVIHRALVTNGYSRSRAANMLGISRVTLYKKMKKYGLTAIPFDSPRAI